MEREPAHDDRAPVLPGAARGARLRDQRLRHHGGAGTGRITGGPLRGGGEQVRNGPQGTSGTDRCPRGVGDRALRAGGLRRGGGAPQRGGEPGPEAGGCPALSRAQLSRARRRSGRRGAPPRVPWSDAQRASDQTSRRRAPADAHGAPLSPQSRHFIATSLESVVKSEQELHDARWVYAPWPYYGYYGYYDPFFWGRSW